MWEERKAVNCYCVHGFLRKQIGGSRRYDEMDERKRSILQAIITDYISTAEPIGSRTIARKYDLGISSATIRNEMSDLEMLGFLEQPHASAGRIPSAKGYRFYVDALLSPTQNVGKGNLFNSQLVSSQSAAFG